MKMVFWIKNNFIDCVERIGFCGFLLMSAGLLFLFERLKLM